MSIYMCVGASGMLAVVIAVYLFIKFFKYIRVRYDAWVERREIDLVNHIVAKRGLVRTEAEPVVQIVDTVNSVFNPVITHKIYHCASKVDLIKDDAGQPALQFMAGDGDGQHTYALLSNGTMYVRVAGEWMSTGDKAKSSALILNMQPRKQLPAGDKQAKRKGQQQDDTEGITSTKAQKWYDNHVEFKDKPGPFAEPEKWTIRQVSGGKWVVQPRRDRRDDE